MKKILSLFMVALAVVTLVACGPKQVKVTFETNGGSEIAAVELKKGDKLEKPADPTKEDHEFVGWFEDEALTVQFSFEKPIEANITIYAKWTEKLVVSFNTKTKETIETKIVLAGETIEKPADPTPKEGFVFKGWFNTKRGLTWLEPEAVEFPLTVEKSMSLHAYYEPINSAEVEWSENETYTSAMQSDTVLILNPFTYNWNHENTYMSMMATTLYTNDIDWDKAIEKGIADHPGDFTKIANKEFSIDALERGVYLEGAVAFPKDQDGNDHLIDGKYDSDTASKALDTVWRFELRQDLKFSNGTPITAKTYEFALQQYLDKDQNNSRSNSYYKTEENKNGFPIVKAFEYLQGKATWEEVGFKVIDDYTFELTTTEPISQTRAVAFGDMLLVEPEVYTQSLNAQHKSTYGTPKTPFVSYGSYIMKTWDENQKIIFNKNYEYIRKGIINYKCLTIQIVDNIDQQMELFEQGKLSVTGLNKGYYKQYAEDPNVKKSFSGFPHFLIINLSENQDIEENPTGNKRHPILFDKEFRQALYFVLDRTYYTNNVYAPNTPSLVPYPVEARNYQTDPITYMESTQHAEVLAKHNVNADTLGYDLERAKTLFNAAYQRWVDAGNSGKIVLQYPTDTSEFAKDLDNYMKETIEKAFGADRIEVNVLPLEAEALRARRQNSDFDLSLSNIGFGISTEAYWQFSAIGLNGQAIGGTPFGLTQPVDASQPDGIYEYMKREVTIDLKATYEFLISGDKDVAYYEGEGLKGDAHLLQCLMPTADKEAGIFKGQLSELLDIIHKEKLSAYDSLTDPPFTGATQDLFNIMAVYEDLYIEFVPIVPVGSRSDAVVYKDNVVIEWPAYSLVFGWGQNRYRYLNTDPDFAE